MLIEEKLEKWVGELSADKRRLQEQLEAVTRERDEARETNRDLNRRVSVVEAGKQQRSDIHALWCKIFADKLSRLETRAEAAEARAARLDEWLAGRDKFIVEQGLWAVFCASLPAALNVKEETNVMSIQDNIFDVQDALKGLPEEKLFEEIMAYFYNIEDNYEKSLKVIAYLDAFHESLMELRKIIHK